MKQTIITIKHIIQKDLAITNSFKYNNYRHTTKTYKTHIQKCWKNDKTSNLYINHNKKGWTEQPVYPRTINLTMTTI